MDSHVPSSVEVARTEAIANIYRQLGSMQFTTADDAYDAALAVAKLSEAGLTTGDVTIALVQTPPTRKPLSRPPRPCVPTRGPPVLLGGH